MLNYFRDFVAAFSKIATNILFKHKPFNHKLHFNSISKIKASHLYKISTRELTVIKEYLIKNLKKDFIKPLSSFFLLSILFVKKKNGDLKFCINYRNLNQLIKKNRCSLSFILEILAQLFSAIIFTKLNIRYTFN